MTCPEIKDTGEYISNENHDKPFVDQDNPSWCSDHGTMMSQPCISKHWTPGPEDSHQDQDVQADQVPQYEVQWSTVLQLSSEESRERGCGSDSSRRACLTKLRCSWNFRRLTLCCSRSPWWSSILWRKILDEPSSWTRTDKTSSLLNCWL